MIEVENIRYKLVKNYRDAFNKDEFVNKFTNFFAQYDIIVGDIAYSKLRLKGFNNKASSEITILYPSYLNNFII